MSRGLLAFILFLGSQIAFSQVYTLKIGKLKYNGGGDWYANKTSMPNLIGFCNKNLKTNIFPEEDIIEPGDQKIFQYPFIHMTGHGNVLFSDTEAKNLRNYLISGGFLHIDDNYGLNKFIRREMKKIFPEHEFVELPFTHPIYHQKFQFNKGLPKVHEHDGLPPQGFGIIHDGKLVCFFSYECDLGNGWEDQSVYNDNENSRQESLKMGANILQFAFTNY
jgi:Domain of unknown function (DUF4159)